MHGKSHPPETRGIRLGRWLAALAIFWSGAVHGQCPPTEDLQRGLVRITTKHMRGSVVEGSGFVVRSGGGTVHVLTVTHVVQGAESIDVEFFARQGSTARGELLFLEGHDENGLAVLKVEGAPENLSPLSLSSRPGTDTSQRVVALGSPRSANVRWATVWGDLVGQSGRSITFSGAIDEGSSGGPLLQCGRVVGVVTHRGDRVAYATPAFLAGYVVDGWLGAESQPASSGVAQAAPVRSGTLVDELEGYRCQIKDCRLLNRAVVCDIVVTNLETKSRWLRVVGTSTVTDASGGERLISETQLAGKSYGYRNDRMSSSFTLPAGRAEGGRLRFDRKRSNPLGLNPDAPSPSGAATLRLELHLFSSSGPFTMTFEQVPLSR